MNKKFIITLPCYLISKICTGEKKYEMRKKVPAIVGTEEITFLVVEKGSGKVTAKFVVDNVIEGTNFSKIWIQYRKHLGINKAYFDKYVKETKKVYLMHIKKASVFLHPLNLKEDLGVKQAPQNYCIYDKPLPSGTLSAPTSIFPPMPTTSRKENSIEKAVQ